MMRIFPGDPLAISDIRLFLLTLLFFRRWLGQNQLPLKRLNSSWVTWSQRDWTQRKSTRSSEIQATVDGYTRIAELETAIDPTQAFVAMWLDDSMNEAFDKGIQPAIEDAGYRAIRIDRKPDVDKIDDEIIAEIRRSRFLVADFTHGDKGARGGVYYEAGFAYGLGKPVIYTCRADMVDYLHFDTRQYAHILWETPEELREGLKNKIVARIGEGTVLHTATQK